MCIFVCKFAWKCLRFKEKKKENTLSAKKVRFKKIDNDQEKGDRIKHLAAFFRYIQVKLNNFFFF